jgi:hypothetical protein
MILDVLTQPEKKLCTQGVCDVVNQEEVRNMTAVKVDKH